MDYNQTPSTDKKINLLDLILIVAGILVVVLLLVLGYFGIKYLKPQNALQSPATQTTNVPGTVPVATPTAIAQPKVPPVTPMAPVAVSTTTSGGILMYGQISNIFLGSVTITKIPLSTASAVLKLSASLEPGQVRYSTGSASLSVPQSLFKGDIKTGDFANVYGDTNSVTQIDILE